MAKRGGGAGREKGKKGEGERGGWCGIRAGEATETEVRGDRETVEAGVGEAGRGVIRHVFQGRESP